MNSWANIYKSHYPTVKSVCIRYVKSLDLAEDITQDTFITAIEKASQYNKKGSVEGWIKRIAINKCLDHLKREKKLQLASNELKHLQNDENKNEMKPSNKSLILAHDYTQDDLLQVIDQLPGHHKEVFNLYVIDKLSHKEIANLLGISLNTSKSHLLRARKKVQEELLKIAQQNEEKKKRRLGIFYLLPLGLFTNNLFSSTLNKHYSVEKQNIPDYIIQADKKGIVIPKQFIFLHTKTILLALSLSTIIIVGVVYFVAQNSHSKEAINTKNLTDDIPNESVEIIDTSKNLSTTLKLDSINSNSNTQEKNNEALPKEVSSENNIPKTKKEPKKDSSQLTKKVVIPKKVYLLKEK